MLTILYIFSTNSYLFLTFSNTIKKLTLAHSSADVSKGLTSLGGAGGGASRGSARRRPRGVARWRSRSRRHGGGRGWGADTAGVEVGAGELGPAAVEVARGWGAGTAAGEDGTGELGRRVEVEGGGPARRQARSGPASSGPARRRAGGGRRRSGQRSATTALGDDGAMGRRVLQQP